MEFKNNDPTEEFTSNVDEKKSGKKRKYKLCSVLEENFDLKEFFDEFDILKNYLYTFIESPYLKPVRKNKLSTEKQTKINVRIGSKIIKI